MTGFKGFLKKLENTPVISIWLLGIVFLAIWGLTLGLYIYQFHGGLAATHDIWGQFGDYLGGTLNPVLGTITAVGLLITLNIQIKEVKRAEKKKEQDEKDRREEKFQAQFFNLLAFHNDNVSHTKISSVFNNATFFYEGRECFKVMVEEYFQNNLTAHHRKLFCADPLRFARQAGFQAFHARIRQALLEGGHHDVLFADKEAARAALDAQGLDETLAARLHPGVAHRFHDIVCRDFQEDLEDHIAAALSPEETLAAVHAAYAAFHADKGHLIGHYFRNLFSITSFIADADVPNPEFYLKTLRAQLSSFEIIMIFYNMVGGFAPEELNRQLIRDGILKDIGQQQFFHAANWRALLEMKLREAPRP